MVAAGGRWPALARCAAAGVVLAALSALTILSAPTTGMLALVRAGESCRVHGLSALLALAIMRLARAGIARLAGLARLALANLCRPGAPTPIVVLSLGLGLTVLVAVALIEGNLRASSRETMPGDAPTFFFIDIQPDQMPTFDKLVRGPPASSELDSVPMLRGRIVTLNGVPVERGAARRRRWALEGDRGITWSATVPPGPPARRRRMVAGGLSGPPLISLDAEVARGLRPQARRHHLPSTCWAATSPPRSPICARSTGRGSRSISSWCSRRAF